MSYHHVQHGRFHYPLLAIAGLELALVTWLGSPPVRPFGYGFALLFVLLALSFATLTVRDCGARLALRFGPLPLFRRSVPYASVRGVRVARSDLVDGWGIHWLPGRGWIWNIHGRDCVGLDLEGGRLRIGTSDPEGLAALVAARIGSRPRAGPEVRP